MRPQHTTAAAASRVFKTTEGTLHSLEVVNGDTDGYVMVLDSATVPADGDVGALLMCAPLAIKANAFLAKAEEGVVPTTFLSGLVIVLSSTGPFTLTIQTGSANLGYIQAKVS